MIADTAYVELLVAHRPVKPRNRKELAGLTALLESLAANETRQPPAMERFIETLTALIEQYEDEIEPDPEGSPAGVLKYLMEERGVRQIDLVPILGSKSYVSQILSGHRPISKDAAYKLAEFFQVSAYSFI
jgi:HTH-type transcriptional regulator/antitoxin HigA